MKDDLAASAERSGCLRTLVLGTPDPRSGAEYAVPTSALRGSSFILHPWMNARSPVHSGLAPESRITFAHVCVSARIFSAISRGVVAITS